MGEIDRTEQIQVIYTQRGTELEARRGNWNSPAGDPTVTAAARSRRNGSLSSKYADGGGIALGAFSYPQLVGIGLVLPHLRPTSPSSRSST